MKIAIITNEAFPNGYATPNRIISLSKALIEKDNFVKVYCVRPTEKINNQQNFQLKGNIYGINYEYVNNSLIWPNNKIKKIIVSTLGVIFWIIRFLKHNINNRYDVLICTTTPLFSNIIYYVISKLFSIKFISTIDEYPIFVRNPNKSLKIINHLYLKIYPKLFDGFIIMTKSLIEYWRKFKSKNFSFIHIPMTVDIERFSIKTETPELMQNKKCITYCGNLGHNEKDGVPTLIKAFSNLIKKNYDFYLIIIGDSKASERNQVLKLYDLVNTLNIKDRVIFTGKIHKDLIPDYLISSEILALARPDNIQAKGGFPTKLGEYLATKRPVVVTKVGEIPEYLNENSAYLCEPDSAESFTKVLEKAIKDDNKMNVGMNGYNIALKYFSYHQYSEKLNSFLNQLNKNIK